MNSNSGSDYSYLGSDLGNVNLHVCSIDHHLKSKNRLNYRKWLDIHLYLEKEPFSMVQTHTSPVLVSTQFVVA